MIVPALPIAPASARSLRWAVGVGLAVVGALALVLLFLLTQATNQQTFYEQNYGRLLALNVAVAALLLLVIVWIVARLLGRLRRGKFGSRLLLKLASIFALVGLVPGLLIYVVSYQFVSRSIESWFDVKVERALDAGLNLGRATLDTLASGLAAKAQSAANQLAGVADAGAGVPLERVREQLGASDARLWSANGQFLAGVGESRYQLQPERPSPAQLRAVRSQRVLIQWDGLDEAPPGGAVARIQVLVLVPSGPLGLLNEPRILQVLQPLPPALVTNAIAVQDANREYQERALARGGLRRMYIGTLTLTLFLAVFAAIVLAVLLGNQLASPLLVLADGVRQVAAGDLRPKAALQTRDELGGLTRSFADMTQQLADAREAVNHSMRQVNAARTNLQTILDNLTTGVMVLDAHGFIRSCNPGAARILRLSLASFVGYPLHALPGLLDFAVAVQQQFAELRSEGVSQGPGHWQQAFALNDAAPGAPPNPINLIARGAQLPDAENLLVFDDISDIVSGQRAQAWAEVARRLAHEIKNPLTPIQLSAERLHRKLDGKLADAEQAVLNKSIRTIIDQVDAMKRLVNEFRDYARLPSADIKPVDLNALITDMLALYDPENAIVPVRCELDPACPPVPGDSGQLRQVIHNLLQNAQDATETAARREVLIKTQWRPAARRVRLSVQDSGPGFADHILQRAFEPYVTTKAKGTGLGLAVVKKIADDHGAHIAIVNRVVGGVVRGAQVSLSFALDAPTGHPDPAPPLATDSGLYDF